MRHQLRILAAVLVCLLAALPILAQSTTAGGLMGTVTDASGAALPGVTVELSGPAMQGTRTTVTDQQGSYVLRNIPPGENYKVTATLSGFAPTSKTVQRVSLGQDFTVNLMLQAALSEAITVTAEAPLVDVTNTTTGVNVTSAQFESLPTQRSFQQLTAIAPGVDMEMANSRPGALENSPTVGAASAPENNYIIDGLSTTDMKYGTSGTNLTMNFVEEVQVMTGGYSAEYGRSTGGVFNVVTKSGGNDIRGDIFAYYQNKGWSDSAVRQQVKELTILSTKTTNADVGFSIGGPIVRDRLWFFGAYDPTRRTDYRGGVLGGPTLVADESRTMKRKTNFYAAKLTGSINQNHNLAFSAFGDPRERTGFLTKPEQDPGTQQKAEEGSTNMNLRYTGVITPAWLVEANIGRAKQKAHLSPLNEIGSSVPRQIDETAGAYWYGGIMRESKEDATRQSYAIKSTNFVGRHEFRYGIDVEDNGFDSDIHERWYRYYGQTAPTSQCTLATPVNGLSNCWQLRAQEYTLLGAGDTKNQAAFLQDQWKVLPNLQVNLGVRYETQELTSALGVRVGVDATAVDSLKLDNNWAPRLGIVWDPLNNGRSKVYAFGGRYFEAIPLDMNLRAINGETYLFQRYYSRTNADNLAWLNQTGDPLNKAGFNWTRYSNSPLDQYTPLDPDLKAQYQDELILGGDYQFAGAWSAGVRLVNRELKRVIEDFGVFGDPDDPLLLTAYIIGNPGEGTFGAPFEKPKRRYRAAELTLQRARTGNWQLYSSFVYAQARGNYEGLYLSGYEQLDPNITAYYDIPSMLVNAYGKMRSDKPYQFKVHSSYTFPFGLTVAEGFQFSAGSPYDRRGPEIYNGYSDGTIFLTPRGTGGRTPDYWSLDLHADYRLPWLSTGGRALSLIVDAFNVTNQHTVLEVDPDYVYEGMDPAILAQWEDPSNLDASGNPVFNASLPASPFYGTPTLYQQPRAIQVGVKFNY
jgi:outer membrane receptor protein involved in Fe transport